MPSLKDIKNRIASIRNTQKITSAMHMVASAKLHHTQGLTATFLRYKDELQSILDLLQEKETDATVPTDSPEVSRSVELGSTDKTVLLIPISSNTGLCGAFNSNIARATFQQIEAYKAEGKQVRVLPIGKKIAHELKKANFEFSTDYLLLQDQVGKDGIMEQVNHLIADAQDLLSQGEITEMAFIYHHFKSMGSQVITTTPIVLRQTDQAVQSTDPSNQPTDQSRGYLTEPSRSELLTTLYPRLLNAQVYSILLDSLTSEHAARMLAMQTADDNANDLLKDLTLLYNKTRQQAVTNELVDIMGGRAAQN